MDYELSKPQQLLQESVRTFCQRECPLGRVREIMETDSGHDQQLWDAMAEQGWIGLHLPEQYGGLDLSLVDLAVVIEQLGYACIPGPFLSTTWAATLLAESGNQQLADQYLPKVVDGTLKMTMAMLEEDSSWDVGASQQQTNFRDGCLSGSKRLVLNADIADMILCVAKHDEGLGLVMVSPSDEHVQVTTTRGMDATRQLQHVELRDVKISPERIIAVGDAAADALRRSMHVVSAAVCAELVGVMQWMLDATVEYTKTRRQFDRTIGSFQAVQHQCADMLLLTESARSAAYYAAWSLNENEPGAERAVSIAKAYCSDGAREVGNRAVQVHGGVGFTWEHDLHLYYKRSKADEYLFGDASFHRERVARLTIDSHANS